MNKETMNRGNNCPVHVILFAAVALSFLSTFMSTNVTMGWSFSPQSYDATVLLPFGGEPSTNLAPRKITSNQKEVGSNAEAAAITSTIAWRQASCPILKPSREKHRIYRNCSEAIPYVVSLTTTTKKKKPCSCWNTTNDCCVRRINRIHKMGVYLVRDLFQNAFGITRRIRLQPALPRDLLSINTVLRREIIVARDFVSAIVSGYLYHKSGRECWMDGVGAVRPANQSQIYHMTNLPWEDHLANPAPWVPARGRNICQYLAEESEEAGLRAFIDFSWEYLYKTWFHYWLHVQHRQDPALPFMRIVCFEDLSDPAKQLGTFHEMMDWLFPGGYEGPRHPDPPSQHGQEYTGAHSTRSKDPHIKNRLRSIVQRLDRDIFNDTLAKADEAFGCGLRRRPLNLQLS